MVVMKLRNQGEAPLVVNAVGARDLTSSPKSLCWNITTRPMKRVARNSWSKWRSTEVVVLV